MADFLELCVTAVRRGGSVLLEKLGQVSAREKGPADLVTEADMASQELIRRTLLEAFPDHAFLGEEDDEASVEAAGQGEYRWIADPLDGTTNYVHGVPHFCVSLALERAGELLVGVVYNPVADECYTAEAGKGAFLNGDPIQTSRVAELPQALAATGFPTVVRPDSPDLQLFLKAVEVCQAVRRTGSCALNMCYLAAGRFDATWAYSAKIWDVAAGALIIREAGGVITSPEGGVFVLEDSRLLAAATPALHAELRGLSTKIDD
jgi:myo-inositol-1(or 4)-monophosphatase